MRRSGVLMPVSALWGEYSVGGFGKAAEEFIDFLAAGGFRVWQVLPFCLPDEYHSPYRSYGAFSFNPYFIDLAELKEDGLLTAAEVASAKQKTPYLCEFDRLDKERMPLLAKAAARCTEFSEMSTFFDLHPDTAAFCAFMAKKEERAGGDYEKSLALWRFTQYAFYKQWRKIKAYANARGISVVGDIPIYVSDDSSDVAANPLDFQLDEKGKPTAVAGVPPDYFAKDGQMWGNPLYDYDRMKENGYAFWRRRMAFVAELFDGVRIDHFRGFDAYYSIPVGAASAKEGKWVKGPGLPFVKMLKREAGKCELIAEDLGDITASVKKLVEKSGCPGMRVFEFGFLFDEDSPHLPHNYPANCVAYTGTHDNNTLLGYMWEADDATKARIQKYVGFEGHFDRAYDAILRTMFASHADTVILPIQDLCLFGADTRLNTPGKASGNWALRLTKEQIRAVPAEKFHAWNELYRRI